MGEDLLASELGSAHSGTQFHRLPLQGAWLTWAFMHQAQEYWASQHSPGFCLLSASNVSGNIFSTLQPGVFDELPSLKLM